MKSYKSQCDKIRHKLGLNRSVVICLCAIMVAFIISMSGTFSKFATSDSFAKFFSTANLSASASVAAFVLEANGMFQAGEPIENSLVIDCSAGTLIAEYPFSVTNDKEGTTAEVSIRYNVIVTLPNNQALPNGVTMKLQDKNNQILSNVTENNTANTYTYTYENAGSFNKAQPDIHEYKLIFEVNQDLLKEDVTLTGINVSIYAQQID